MSQYVDLHLHTTCSDGCHSPKELLRIVRGKNLAAFAVTDHDTLEGYDAMRPLMKEKDPELIPGVELSATVDDSDIHILAYLFDPDNEAWQKALVNFRDWRIKRAKLMVEKLNSLGLGITMEDVNGIAKGSAIGRPHIAEALFARGLTGSYVEAFQRYIGNGKPAYLPKSGLTPAEAIDLIHRAGGVAVMAHPGVADMHVHIEELAAKGLDGLEVYHYAHSQSQIREYEEIAERLNLVMTGGSDFHGRSRRDAEVGSQKVPLSCLDNLKQRVLSIS